MSNIAQFEIEIDEEFDRLVIGGLVGLVQDVAFKVDAGVREKTPVDTGFARSAWNASLEQPVYRAPGTSTAIARMIEPTTVYITNAAEYISALENGHSRQAPQGMVALTLAEVEAHYGRVK